MNHDDIEQRSDKIKAYFPVLIFIVFIFLLEAFKIDKPTSLSVSVLVSLLSLGVIIVKLRQRSGNSLELKPISFILGILTFIFILTVGVAIIHWYQIGNLNLRWGLFFLVMLIYLILLFHALHRIKDIRERFDLKS